MTAERKYTDRDVRENPELKEIALRYLNVYGGDFEPLVNAQGMLAAGGELPTNIIRVVLNCMRHDRDYAADMPQPEAKVIQMPKTKKQKKRSWRDKWDVPCGNEELHQSHKYERDGEDDWYCTGVGLNRGEHGMVLIKASIKVPYAKAKSGKMIHLVDEFGDNYFKYTPNQYGPGYLGAYIFLEEGGYIKPKPPRADLHIKLRCKYPSWIINPILVREIPPDIFNYDGTPLTLCRHCKEIADGD